MKNIESYAARTKTVNLMLNANECYKNISAEIVEGAAGGTRSWSLTAIRMNQQELHFWHMRM